MSVWLKSAFGSIVVLYNPFYVDQVKPTSHTYKQVRFCYTGLVHLNTRFITHSRHLLSVILNDYFKIWQFIIICKVHQWKWIGCLRSFLAVSPWRHNSLFFFLKSFTNFKGQKNKREYPTTFRNLIKQGNNHTMR